MKKTAGQEEHWGGNTTVAGVHIDVGLTVNTVRLIHELGKKAARSKGGMATALKGAIRVYVTKPDLAAVAKAIGDREASRKVQIPSIVLGKVV